MPVNSIRRPSVARTQSTNRSATTTRVGRRSSTGFSGRSTFESGRAGQARSAVGTRTRARSLSRSSEALPPPPGSSTGTLRRGMANSSVKALQQRLNASGFDVGTADGKFGPRTEAAVRDYQRSQGLRADGIVGRRTFQALNGGGASNGTTGTNGTRGTGSNSNAATGVDGTARMDRVQPGRGLATGTITVNGNTYQFNSGSSRLFSTPTGTYRVTAHRNSRSDAGFTRNGVGFSFRMEDPRRPGSDRFYDPRAGRDRTALRIHPDGGARGTAGCLGIVGDAATLRRFRDDMNAELRRNNGVYTLRVQ